VTGSLLLAACGGKTSAPQEASGGQAGLAGSTNASGASASGGNGATGDGGGGISTNPGSAGDNASGTVGSVAGRAGAGGTESLGGASGADGLSGNAGFGGATPGGSCGARYITPLGQLGQLAPPLTADPVEATQCSPGIKPPGSEFDECACEERSCSAGTTCVLVTQPARFAAGGPNYERNGCFELCVRDADCAAPKVCVRNVHGLDVCAEVECRTDADCDEDPCGNCVPGFYVGHGGTYDAPALSHCAYGGGLRRGLMQ